MCKYDANVETFEAFLLNLFKKIKNKQSLLFNIEM